MNPPQKRRTSDVIRDFFLAHEDGEFVVAPRDLPFQVIGASREPSWVLVVTKVQSMMPHLVDRSQKTPEHFSVVGRAGLPNPWDAAWLAEWIGERPACFLGDLDPVDLLVYAWLRRRVDGALNFVGISDHLLFRMGLRCSDVPSLECSPAEKKALPLVKRMVGEASDRIGPDCLKLLESGRKIELETFLGMVDTRDEGFLYQVFGHKFPR